MNVRTEITELHAHTDTYTYRLRQYKGKWTVLRWKAGEIAIPPRMELLSLLGWVGVIKASNEFIGSAHFDSSEQALAAALEA
jgi:hypothetical protein